MLPQLFSVSGLAVELGLDRRTVAAKLRNLRPDGILPGGFPAWRLTTALPAMNGPRWTSNRSEVFDPIADLLENRMANPEIVTEGDRMLLTVSEAAQMLETDCETVLLWLRTGAPYATVGDWRDGSGFVVDLSWLVNWLLLVGAHLTLMGNRDLQDALRLPG
jgi:hypothetical protein